MSGGCQQRPAVKGKQKVPHHLLSWPNINSEGPSSVPPPVPSSSNPWRYKTSSGRDLEISATRGSHERPRHFSSRIIRTASGVGVGVTELYQILCKFLPRRPPSSRKLSGRTRRHVGRVRRIRFRKMNTMVSSSVDKDSQRSVLCVRQLIRTEGAGSIHDKTRICLRGVYLKRLAATSNMLQPWIFIKHVYSICAFSGRSGCRLLKTTHVLSRTLCLNDPWIVLVLSRFSPA